MSATMEVDSERRRDPEYPCEEQCCRFSPWPRLILFESYETFGHCMFSSFVQFPLCCCLFFVCCC